MKALLGALAIGIIAAAQPVAARPWSGGPVPVLQGQDQRMYPRGQDRRGQRDQRDMRRDPRMGPERDMRRDPRRAPEGDERSRGRLTDEERQDLRQDIDKANREIYRRRQLQR